MNNQLEWWQEFFSGLVLDFVQESRDQETTLEEAHFIEQALEIQPGDKILDVPCGGGRLALQLAGRGYQVTGVDISAELLESASRRAEDENLQVNWKQGDMRDLPWPGEFDAALCFWSSFGYFDEAENAAFLKAVSRSLKPGARFLLDTPLIETRLPEMEAQERIWWPVGNLLALEERNFDHETSRVESEWTFIRDGQTERKLLSLRLYTYRELTLLLEQAGFGNLQAYGSLDWEPFGLGSTWLYLVTTKLSDPI
ncbi:MAG: class I SAM-dependent methyltransferase [Chloroflexi bacterium]|nr:class I SAM-dependent methyltransferase [Chloroflexota bacterium]MDA1218395.1 class I SAM-dependent methyltransferase [Chloroflexota bacterium]